MEIENKEFNPSRRFQKIQSIVLQVKISNDYNETNWNAVSTNFDPASSESNQSKEMTFSYEEK